MLFAGVNGYLDKIALGDIGRFESGLLDTLRGSGKAILDNISVEKKISDDTKTKLKDAVETFAKSFA